MHTNTPDSYNDAQKSRLIYPPMHTNTPDLHNDAHKYTYCIQRCTQISLINKTMHTHTSDFIQRWTQTHLNKQVVQQATTH